MELKDWIILLVPILIEGIIIAFYNKHLEKRFKEMELKQERKTKKEETFMDYIDDARKKFIHMKMTMNNEENSLTWEKPIAEFTQSVQMFYNHFNIYSNSLINYSQYVMGIFNAHNENVDIINKASKNGKFNDEDGKKITDNWHLISAAFDEIDRIYNS